MQLKEAFATLETLLAEAGALALLNFGKAKQQIKPDKSMLTETDLAISQMAQEKLKPFIAQGHVLIDEESINTIGTPEEVFASSTYQWVIDPIDGTAAYAAGRDDWGIYLALLGNGKPLIGGMNMPQKGIMLLADGEKVHVVRQGQREVLEPRQTSLGYNGFLHFIGYYAEMTAIERASKAWPIADGSSISTMMEVFLGQSNGAICQKGNGCIWDFAAAFAVAHTLGFTCTRLPDLTPVTAFGPQHFTPAWKINMSTLWSRPEYVKPINELIEFAKKEMPLHATA